MTRRDPPQGVASLHHVPAGRRCLGAGEAAVSTSPAGAGLAPGILAPLDCRLARGRLGFGLGTSSLARFKWLGLFACHGDLASGRGPARRVRGFPPLALGPTAGARGILRLLGLCCAACVLGFPSLCRTRGIVGRLFRFRGAESLILGSLCLRRPTRILLRPGVCCLLRFGRTLRVIPRLPDFRHAAGIILGLFRSSDPTLVLHSLGLCRTFGVVVRLFRFGRLACGLRSRLLGLLGLCRHALLRLLVGKSLRLCGPAFILHSLGLCRAFGVVVRLFRLGSLARGLGLDRLLGLLRFLRRVAVFRTRLPAGHRELPHDLLVVAAGAVDPVHALLDQTRVGDRRPRRLGATPELLHALPPRRVLHRIVAHRLGEPPEQILILSPGVRNPCVDQFGRTLSRSAGPLGVSTVALAADQLVETLAGTLGQVFRAPAHVIRGRGCG